jgi:hypothetical protein
MNTYNSIEEAEANRLPIHQTICKVWDMYELSVFSADFIRKFYTNLTRHVVKELPPLTEESRVSDETRRPRVYIKDFVIINN